MGTCSAYAAVLLTLAGRRTCGLVLCCALALGCLSAELQAAGQERVLRLIGAQDALVLAGPDDTILLQKNADTPLIPASTLKLVSALAVMDALGRDHRFETHFYTSTSDAVTIKGFGDPLLVSEIVADMAAAFHAATQHSNIRIRRLYVDDTYFKKPIKIPGTTPSTQPYDAPPGAFCVNFNTVNYRIVDGNIHSAEPQTPLLPFAAQMIRRNHSGTGDRIVLSHDKDAIALYAARLCAHFLTRTNSPVVEQVGLRPVDPAADTRLLVYRSPLRLTDLVQKMMAYSNNFIANQMVIAAGANRYGPPGTLAKGVRMLKAYCRQTLDLQHFTIVEGSGIARQNRMTARSLLRVLTTFEPHRNLLRNQKDEYFKTGTLTGVSSRVGYLRRPAGGFYRFVIMMNTPGRSAVRVKRALGDYLKENHFP